MRKLLAALPILLFLLCANSAHAQVAFGVNGGSANMNATSTLTFSLSGITSGANLIGIVHVSTFNASTAPITVTWGGVSMTAACSLSTYMNRGVAQIFWIAAPATGTPQIVVTEVLGLDNITADGVTFTGADQSNPVRSGSCTSTNAASGPYTISIPSQSGDMTTSSISSEDNSFSTNQTLLTNNDAGADVILGSDYAAGATTVADTWTETVAGRGAVSGFSIAAAGAASGHCAACDLSKLEVKEPLQP